jgi:hypothetical protein
LIVAAVLEAGGDATVRKGLSESSWRRALWFLLGGIILFSYGYLVNRPPWKFGELKRACGVLFCGSGIVILAPLSRRICGRRWID